MLNAWKYYTTKISTPHGNAVRKAPNTKHQTPNMEYQNSDWPHHGDAEHAFVIGGPPVRPQRVCKWIALDILQSNPATTMEKVRPVQNKYHAFQQLFHWRMYQAFTVRRYEREAERERALPWIPLLHIILTRLGNLRQAFRRRMIIHCTSAWEIKLCGE